MDGAGSELADEALDPEEPLLQQRTVARVRAVLEQLPRDFREVIGAARNRRVVLQGDRCSVAALELTDFVRALQTAS